jgi:hypothetical protein
MGRPKKFIGKGLFVTVRNDGLERCHRHKLDRRLRVWHFENVHRHMDQTV